MNDAGVNDSALLLLSIGEEAAAEVMKHLAPKEVQKVVEAMARVQGVTRDKVETVLASFHEAAATRTAIAGSDGYVRSVLTRALGEERATYLVDRILGGADASGIENLKWMDAQSVAELVRGEHPQIIASILAYLDRDQASEVLMQLPDKLRGDVVLRIATLDAIQPNAMKELNDVLAKLLSGGSAPAKKATPGGVRAAAEILNFMGATNETAVIEAVREHDADLAQKIVDEMFVFENLLDVDDRGIQALLREVQSESLIVALKGANEELRDKIFRNMSQRAAEMLRDDLDAKGPVRVSEVETEQKEILKIVRRMAEEGQIAIGGKGDDEFV